MRLTFITAAAMSLCTSLAFAQTPASQTPASQAPASHSGPQNPAVKSMDANNASAPVAGANSFTMGEAKSHIEDKGFTKVHALKKDKDGVWRGMAMKDGKSVPVSLDYQGNVNN
jgi:putative membrane protein